MVHYCFLFLVLFLYELITAQNITALVSVLTAAFAVIISFATWRTDRKRLVKLENDRDKMREDFEKHKEETIETFKEVREMIHSSNKQVLDKVDDLKMYLLQSKITIKGKDEKDRE